MYRNIILAGGTYQHNDLSLSAQRTINYLPQLQDAGNERSPYILESFYGLKPFATGSGLNRGMFEHQDILYKLNATTFSSVSSSGVFSTLGTIPGNSRAIFDGLSNEVIITADGVPYTWNGSVLTTGTDPDFESPDTVTVLNSQAIYDGTGGRFGVSDVGVPLSIDGLNYATAESKADDLVRPFAFINNVYMFGVKAIEQWWNSGIGNPPFDRIEGGLINIGLGAVHSVAPDDEVVYFLGANNQVYQLNGGVPTELLPKAIVREITGFSDASDAIAWTMKLDGQWFYVIKFPTGDRTFIFPRNGQWFELSSGVLGGKYIGDSYAFAFRKHLIADEDGDIFELDIDTFEENGLPIKRVRTLSPIHGGLFGLDGKQLEISFLKLIGKTGTGILSGQGSDPKIILEYSHDGENFSSEIWGDVGELGKQVEIIFDINDSGENWIFRISSTDPVYSSWHSAGIEFEIGI